MKPAPLYALLAVVAACISTCYAASSENGGRSAALQRLDQQLSAILPPGRPKWALSNAFQGVVSSAASSDLVSGAAMDLLVWIPIAMLFALIAHAAGHLLLSLAAGNRYRKLEQDQRLVTAQHTMFALAYTLQVVPYTLLFARIMFVRWDAAYLAGTTSHLSDLPAMVGLFIFWHAAMYGAEASLRTLVRRNAIVLLHHALFFLLLALSCWFADVLVIKATLVLDLGAAHEFPLFWALLAHRLSGHPRVTRVLLVVGTAWYEATRVLQTCLLAWMLAACDPGLRRTGGYWTAAVFGAALTAVQGYTFVIYWGLYKRAGKGAGTRAVQSAAELGAADADAAGSEDGKDA
ncbi:hypothetical protein DFJ74DRAFT_742960 [Hyaloraphidium curvatum]|nr:hypothetical protein DFJ74DRAFT_742960 [Hyaloraphidium curvatum]